MEQRSTPTEDTGSCLGAKVVCSPAKPPTIPVPLVESRVFTPGLSPQPPRRVCSGVCGRRRAFIRRHHSLKGERSGSLCRHYRACSRDRVPTRASLAGRQVEEHTISLPVQTKNGHHGSLKSLRCRRSSSCPSLRVYAKSPRLTQGQRVARKAPVPDSNLPVLLEKVIDNLDSVIKEFQHGICARDYTNGDLAARNGHVHIARAFAKRFTGQAMVLAAAQGHLEMVIFLHHNRKEGTTTDCMDVAATYGHLDVVRWLHFNRAEGCTTRALDGAARNGHLKVGWTT